MDGGADRIEIKQIKHAFRPPGIGGASGVGGRRESPTGHMEQKDNYFFISKSASIVFHFAA